MSDRFYRTISTPRTITAWDELHDLPTGTVLRDSEGHIAAKAPDPLYLTGEVTWRIAGMEGEAHPYLPATVLYTPEVEA